MAVWPFSWTKLPCAVNDIWVTSGPRMRRSHWWYLLMVSQLCLCFIHFDDHRGMKPLRIRFFFKNTHVIKWCVSVIASVWTWMEQIAIIQGWPLMLMPFSHTQYPQSKADQAQLVSNIVLLLCREVPIPVKDAGWKTTQIPCGFSSPFKPITRQVTHCRC